MSFWEKITSAVGGSLFGEVKDLITDYFPPDMSPKQKAELQQKLSELEAKKTQQLHQASIEADRVLNERIENQEGTASDLKQLPIVGRIVLFLRGTQRPVWGFFAMYMDYVWFTSPSTKLIEGVQVATYTEQQQTALIVINILVLTFLFGERSIKNLEPLIMKVFGNNEKAK